MIKAFEKQTLLLEQVNFFQEEKLNNFEMFENKFLNNKSPLIEDRGIQKGRGAVEAQTEF